MWEYDQYGYLKYEKAVGGLLTSLIQKWKEKKCCHDVTIVVFSRMIYDNSTIDDFPAEVRKSVRENHRGELYIDFYKCVQQGLIEDENLIQELYKIIHNYDEIVQIEGCPRGRNTTAASGNFLEAINFSLNMFEKHQVDRNFDRCGQLIVCITPGVGVFEVDRNLQVLTCQRMLDNGIGKDLICLGQQPLHAVPLFILNNLHSNYRKTSNQFEKSKVFESPNWINHSFYTVNPYPDKGTTNINYIPRINIPMETKKEKCKSNGQFITQFSETALRQHSEILPAINTSSYKTLDYNVFGGLKPDNLWLKYQKSLKNSQIIKSEIVDESIAAKISCTKNNSKKFCSLERPRNSKISNTMTSPTSLTTLPVKIPHSVSVVHLSQSFTSNKFIVPRNSNSSNSDSNKRLVGSANALLTSSPVIEGETQYQMTSSATMRLLSLRGGGRTKSMYQGSSNKIRSRQLFNPFNPSNMDTPKNSNRRRWGHTYPKGSNGQAIVLHHQDKKKKKKKENKYGSLTRGGSSLKRLTSKTHRLSESTTDEELKESPYSYKYNSFKKSFAKNRKPGSKPSSFNARASSLQLSSSHGSRSTVVSCRSTNSVCEKSEEKLLEVIGKSNGSSTDVSANRPKQQPREGMLWAWGLSGDLQWTPDIDTGLDWKSLQTPASLPITTDHDPNTNLFDQVHHYSRISEDISSDVRSVKELLLEFVNQRLCQGFQIVKDPEIIMSKKKRNHKESFSSTSTIVSPGSNSAKSHPTDHEYFWKTSDKDVQFPDAFKMTHERSLCHELWYDKTKECVQVVIYRQSKNKVKETDNTQAFHLTYTYMMWPKLRDRYQADQCNFKYEKLNEHYWNRHDCYITDSIDNQEIEKDLKFWQSRFVVIPSPQNKLKLVKPKESGITFLQRFDVFNDKPTFDGSEIGYNELLENFIKYLHDMNDIRQPSSRNKTVLRKTWTQKSMLNLHIGSNQPTSRSYMTSPLLHNTSPSSSTDNHHKPATRCHSSTPSNKNQVTLSLFSPSGGDVNKSLADGSIKQPVPIRSRHHTAGAAVQPAIGIETGGKNLLLQQTGLMSSNIELRSANDENSHNAALAAMQNDITGLKFLPSNKDLPNKSFLAIDAVNWAIDRFDGIKSVNQACEYFEEMRIKNLIIHVSGEKTREFKNGYILFSIQELTSTINELEDPSNHQYDRPKVFCEKEWVEVEFKTDDRNITSRSENVSSFKTNKSFMRIKNKLQERPIKNPQVIKCINLRLNNRSKTHRKEWCQIKHNVAIGQPNVDRTSFNQSQDDILFTFELQWMVATAMYLKNLLANWSRSAIRHNLYLVPVPKNPFPPHSHNFDPIRAPRFVPVNLDIILANHPELQQEKKPLSVELNLVLIEIIEKILFRFGFLKFELPSSSDFQDCYSTHCGDKVSPNKNLSTRDYIHFTGQLLAGIPVRNNREVYRHSIGANLENESPEYENCTENKTRLGENFAGVYWTHNYMQTKNWTSQCPQLEECPWKLVTEDFVRFCEGKDSRLEDFVANLVRSRNFFKV